MSIVPFDAFQEAETVKFTGACERHGLIPSDFSVLDFRSGHESSAPIFRVRVDYRPTGNAAFNLCGKVMSWLAAFEIDLRTPASHRPVLSRTLTDAMKGFP